MGMPPMTVPPKTDLEEMYLVDKKSTKYIAEKYNCAPCTVLVWLHIHDIPTRIAKSRRYEAMDRRVSTSKRGDTCEILKQHAADLKEDPERLSTEFLQNLIGVQCDKQEGLNRMAVKVITTETRR